VGITRFGRRFARCGRMSTAVVAAVASVCAPNLRADAQTSSSKAREAERLERELDALDREMSLLAEDANEATEALRRATRASQDALDAVEESERALSSAMNSARSETKRRYVERGTGGFTLSLTLEVNSVRRVYSDLATGRNIDRIDLLDAAREDHARASSRAVQARTSIAKQKASIERSMRRLDRLAAQQSTLLERTRADVTKLLAVEEKRRIEAEAAEARRVATQRQVEAKRLLAERRANEARDAASRRRGRTPQLRSATTVPSRGSDGEAGRRTPSDAALAAAAGQPSGLPPASGADLAVRVALDQLGKQYVWGGSGSETFDCSGLTGFAWARAGKRLPHSSRAQYAVTQRVARSELRPGDLLFFGTPIHHVGMYIGNGEMVEAPHRRAKVRIRSAWRRDYVGAGRVR
jgi:peptidoglycan DL-endopeptidase CwlO